MREFILYSRNGVTSSGFSIEDLPGSGGRMDLVCRCIISALWISDTLRENTRIYVSLNGPPTPPVSLLFDGYKLKKISPDERNVAIWIKKALEYSDIAADIWTETHDGIYISKLDFEALLDEVDGTNIYVLDERGENIREVEFGMTPVFVLGDNMGLPKDIRDLLEDRFGKKISVGPKSYFSSQTVTLVHNELDRRIER